MTITFGYCTLLELKAYITARGGTTSTDAGDDAVMEDIVESVSRYIDNQTARRFYKNSTDETRYFEAKDSYCVDIGDLAASPTTVSVDYNNTRTYTDLSGSDWELAPANAALDGLPYSQIVIAPTSTQYFPSTRRGVKVLAKFGFPSVPDNIKVDCEAIALNIYMSRSGQTSGGKVTLTAGGVVIRPEDVPAWVQSDLGIMRRHL
jgi:hypothetical protein